MRIILVGFGTVGQGFVQILRDKADDLRERCGLVARIVGVATRTRGVLYHPNGFDLDALLAVGAQGNLSAYPDSAGLVRDWSIEQLIRQANADVMMEASVSDLQTGQPATDYCLAALDTRKHVITANKGVVALHYRTVQARAESVQKQFRFEGTVMAGTPSIMLARQALAGTTIESARGILNGTTNYMLTQMEGGLSYAQALADAQRLGYAEADPSADVDGWDAAGKALILANAVLGAALSLDDLSVQGISALTPDDLAEASRENTRYRLIAEVSRTGGSVRPQRLPLSDPLAGVTGATNAITYRTDLLGDVTLVGAGAGGQQTGYALLADLLALR